MDITADSAAELQSIATDHTAINSNLQPALKISKTDPVCRFQTRSLFGLPASIQAQASI